MEWRAQQVPLFRVQASGIGEGTTLYTPALAREEKERKKGMQEDRRDGRKGGERRVR